MAAGIRTPAVESGPMRLRACIASTSALLVTLALAAPALAAKGGEGLYGKTNDKVITNAGFILIVGFTLLVTTLSVAQYLLERRKTRK
jgi:phosphatidylglycerophosphate synthase